MKKNNERTKKSKKVITVCTILIIILMIILLMIPSFVEMNENAEFVHTLVSCTVILISGSMLYFISTLGHSDNLLEGDDNNGMDKTEDIEDKGTDTQE